MAYLMNNSCFRDLILSEFVNSESRNTDVFPYFKYYILCIR